MSIADHPEEALNIFSQRSDFFGAFSGISLRNRILGPKRGTLVETKILPGCFHFLSPLEKWQFRDFLRFHRYHSGLLSLLMRWKVDSIKIHHSFMIHHMPRSRTEGISTICLVCSLTFWTFKIIEVVEDRFLKIHHLCRL